MTRLYREQGFPETKLTPGIPFSSKHLEIKWMMFKNRSIVSHKLYLYGVSSNSLEQHRITANSNSLWWGDALHLLIIDSDSKRLNRRALIFLMFYSKSFVTTVLVRCNTSVFNRVLALRSLWWSYYHMSMWFPRLDSSQEEVLDTKKCGIQ